MQRILFFFLLFPALIFSQQEQKINWSKKLEKYKIKPVAAIQIWSTYTLGEEVFDDDSQEYRSVDNRFNTQLRRSRLGVKGQPYENLKFNITAALDLVGRDVLSGTQGGANNGGSPAFRAWNAFVQWRVSQNESFNIIAGYMTPQVGRESITSAFRVPSMEKSWSQNYLRRHLVGTGPGRAVGVNFGGLLGANSEQFSYKYDLGIFNPVFTGIGGNSSGEKSSPLFVGRFVANLGQRESEKYSTGHKINYFGQRKGLSIAVSGAYQNATDLFEKNYAAGGDILFNFGNLNLSGEWTYLWRKVNYDFGITAGHETLLSNTGFARMSYNFDLNNGFAFTPFIMFTQFTGSTDIFDQILAEEFGSLSGKDQSLNFGVNYYFNPNLKLILNYTLRAGDSGENSPGTDINNLFWQTGVGAIRRGNWFGLGLTAVL